MRKKSIVTLCFGVVIALLLNYIAFFGFNIAGWSWSGIMDSKWGIKKGIDLAGGSVLTFQADADSPTDADMTTASTIFQTRLTNKGYTEARISRSDNGKLTVEIPSVFDTTEAQNLLGSVAKLTFADADGNTVLDGATDIEDASYKYGKPTESTTKSQAYVEVKFKSEAKSKFAAATKAAAAKSSEKKNYIAIKMDDAVVSQPSVSEEINSDSCVISGSFTPETAQTLANQIKSGALPFKFNLVSHETVGAELGGDALPAAERAGLIGVLLVMLFMILYYKVPGLIASLSLLIYVGFICLAMGIFRVNLSLSGIAGIVLSIGMAVDADCIIFERMKEELWLGKSLRAAVDAGFHKAFSAIIDSNVTTIISCVVLYLSGIGTVKGFAVTLGIGVVLSMITAIWITRFFMHQVVNLGIKNKKAFYRPLKNTEGGAESDENA